MLTPQLALVLTGQSLKSNNRSISYGKKAIFKMAAAAILNFKNFNFVT